MRWLRRLFNGLLGSPETDARNQSIAWFKLTGRFHELSLENDSLAALPEVWQRELAALWRLEADVNNGAYPQFLTNWGFETYEYASRALHTIGAKKMAVIVDECQKLIDKHIDSKNASQETLLEMIDIAVLETAGGQGKPAGSSLSQETLDRVYELSYEFMDYPDDIATLGLAHYTPIAAAKASNR